MSTRRETQGLSAMIDEAIINRTLQEIERVSTDPVPSEPVKVMDLRIGDRIVTNRRAGKTAMVSNIVTTGDIRHCCSKWRNHRHLSFNDGQKGMCYWDEGILYRAS